MIEVIKSPRKGRKLRGYCRNCGTCIECNQSDASELIDCDTQPGMATRHVACPNCDNKFLWVR